MPQHPREQQDLDTRRTRPDPADPIQERSREETRGRGEAREAEEQQQPDADRDGVARDIGEAPRTGAFPFEKSQ